MNKVILSGRQTADAKVTYTPEGLCIARFSLAVDRRGKDKGADFPNVVAFGKNGEFFEKYGAKGKKWVIEGRLQTGSYEKDGHKVYTTDVIVDTQEFGESKNSETGEPTADINDINSFMTISDDDLDEIPFV